MAYYVDSQSGSDAASGQAQDQAWKSLAQANKAALKPGDSLLFKCGGVWTGQLNLRASGSEAAPILVSAYGEGASPAFENPDNGNANAVNVGADWIVLSRIAVRKVFMVGINVGFGADHTVFKEVEASECGLGMFIAGQYALVTRSSFHDLHTMINTPGGKDDNGAVGVVIANSDIEVSYSAFTKCIGPSYDYVVDGGAVEIWAERDVKNTFIHHNKVYRCCGFFEIGGLGFAVDGVRVAYNELVDCYGAAFVLFNNSGDYTIEQSDFRFENNTVVLHDCAGEKLWTCVAFVVASEPGVFIMRNNLFFVWNADRILANVTAPVSDQNLVFHSGTAWFDKNFTAGPGDIIGKDPLIADKGACAEIGDPPAGDYRPKAGSPLIDAGMSLGITSDLAGVAIAGNPDIGAYEYAPSGGALVRSRTGSGTASGGRGYSLYLPGAETNSADFASGSVNALGRLWIPRIAR